VTSGLRAPLNLLRRPTLGIRLALLVLAVALPLVALNLALVHAGYRNARAQVGGQALDVARGLAMALEGELRGRSMALEVLANSRALAAGDLPTFRAQAEMLVARQAPGAAILLLRPDGEQLLNTAVPPGTPLPRRTNLANQERVLGTGGGVTSDLYLSASAGRPVVAIDVPVPPPAGDRTGDRTGDGMGAPRLILSLVPPLDAFDALIRRRQPGPDWIVAVLDRAGVRVARVPEPERFIGQAVTPELMRAWLGGASEEVVDTTRPDGEHVLSAIVRLPEPYGWGVAVAVSEATLSSPAVRTALALIAAELLVLGFGILLARRVALGVLRPVTELLRLAAAPDGAGQPATSDIHALPEADQLAAALMAEARRRRAATASLVESERRLRLVVAELNHRAKNALATVQSLALQTARGGVGGDAGQFLHAFTARLQSLARAHDLLTAVAWEGAALDVVVQSGLAPWLGQEAGERAPRLVLTVPPGMPMPRVPPGQVQALVMGLHELAVNAVKHGALSVPGGRIEVTCRADPAAAGAAIEWRERDGPPVPAGPPRRGFGTRLLERALAHDLGPGARVTLDFAPDGLRASIRFAPRPVVAQEA
jgi:two-component sensor histidine kinase